MNYRTGTVIFQDTNLDVFDTSVDARSTKD